MARKPLNTFSLSFLDCMCCGFGAIILVFILIIHRVAANAEAVTENLRADIRTQQLRVEVLSAAFGQAATELKERKAQLARLDGELAALSSRIAASAPPRPPEAQPPPPPEPPDKPTPPVFSRADEIQLIGLRMDSLRSLILIDTSASMLDSTIVGIIRRRHLPATERRRAPKWRQAVASVDWLVKHLPPGGSFQVYTFDTKARPLIPDTQGRWLNAGDPSMVKRTRSALHEIAPNGGTSLYAAVLAIGAMRPRPDSIYLVIDGLPTQGKRRSSQTTVTGKERLSYFNSAVRDLPRGIDVNVVLFPLEGDPGSASAYWDLALSTGGAMLTPAEDWQ